MRSILTLAATSLLIGCGQTSAPSFPGAVRDFYYIDYAGSQPVCLKFKVVNSNPVKLSEDPVQVSFYECDGVGGFKPEGMRKLFDWIEDIQAWGAKRKQCLK